VNLVLIDNTGGRATIDHRGEARRGALRELGRDHGHLHGHANIGYGAAHNLVMHGGNTHYHLVLNPDVELAEDALCAALRFFDEHAEIGAIVPAVYRPDAEREYLCKRYPSVLDLALRGFAPRPLRQLFRKRLERYEMRDVIADAVVSPVPVMSGSFMLVRRKAIEATGGFDPVLPFFRDFDWSVRLNRVTQTAYPPSARVVHHGGGAARKGLRHIAYFTRSVGALFQQAHGWKWT
jgi:GT2 family glycosyltransferase